MDYETQKLLFEKDRIITALCDVGNRCTICYRHTSETINCSGCLEYYSDCNCTPLTEENIIFGTNQND